VIGAGLAMPIIGAGIRAAARPFGQFVMRNAPRFLKSGKPMLDKKGVQKVYNISKKNPGTQGFDTNAVGGFFARDPVVRTGGKVISGLLSPTTGGYVAKAARFVVSPTGIATGLIYSNGKYFNKDGKVVPPPKGKVTLGGKVGTSGAPGGGDPDMYYDAPEKELTEAEKAKIESDNRIKQMDKYREIMDIKGMSKNAAYKSLIDAGKIIQEGGNLKEQLKSGKLISNITQAASKRFDKVNDTEAALRSLVAKGEIENVLNKDKNALDKAYKQSALDINKKKLAGANLSEELSAYRTKNNKNASGKTLAGFVMDKGGEVVSIADSVEVDKHIKGGGDSVSFMELIVAKNIEAGKEIIPGMYVVKDSLVTINPDGSVTPNYKIS
jgi:hypothetical protein